MRQAKGVVETARAQQAAQEHGQAQSRNTLVLLVGAPLPSDLPDAQPISAQSIVADLPAGRPAFRPSDPPSRRVAGRSPAALRER